MSLRARMLLAVPLLLVLLAAAAYYLLDAWLESAGGRRAVEQALEERIGLPVTLQGEFSVMLIPAVGVAGTALVVGEPGPAQEAMRSGEYAVSLALAPLLERRLVIRSLRFSHGTFHTGRWSQGGASAAGPGPAQLELPEIERLEIRDFEVRVAAGDDRPYRLRELDIDGFAAGRPAAFELEVEALGRWAGSLAWSPGPALLDVSATGSGPWAGELSVRAGLGLAGGDGRVEVNWAAAPAASGAGVDIRASFRFASVAMGLRVDDLRIATGQLAITGQGCLIGEDPPQLHLELVSERVDFDSLPDIAALGGAGDAPGMAGAEPSSAPDAPGGLAFNVRLSAPEMSAGGALAREAVLQLGGAPDCSVLERVPNQRNRATGMLVPVEPIQ